MKQRRTRRHGRDFEYDVCLSFAGEDRPYVRRVAGALRERGIRVFFDEYAQVDLWGKELYAHLDDVYQNAARFCVLFASRHYAKRVWTNHERESAQARAIREHDEYILPARLDSTQIPGLRPTVGYVQVASMSPVRLATLIKAKVGPRQRTHFFPPVPDLLFKRTRARSRADRERVESKGRRFFEALQRMSADERKIVLTVFMNTCVAELPDNVHVTLDLLRRVTGFPENKIVRLSGGLRSLGFLAQVRDHEPEDEYLGAAPVLVLEWHDFSVDVDDVDTNATDVAHDVLTTAAELHCSDCAFAHLDRLDFSQLASVTFEKDSHGQPANKALQPTSRAKAKEKRESTRRRRAARG